jgi:hypothetical protein
MSEFEDLQKRKTANAESLLKSLIEAPARLAIAEELQKQELVDSWLTAYADALNELKKLVETQKKLCPGHQCYSLLQNEIDNLEKALAHIRSVFERKTALDPAIIREALITICSREHSLVQLLNVA